MKFMCLVYVEQQTFDRMTAAEQRKLTDDTIEGDHDLRRRGHLILGQPLQPPSAAVTLRRRNGVLSATDGPFAESKEWLAGFFLIEARDMAEARSIAAESAILPYSTIEIRPTNEQTHSQTGAARPPIQG